MEELTKEIVKDQIHVWMKENIQLVLDGKERYVNLLYTRPNDVLEYVESIGGTWDEEFDTNGWQWDYSFSVEIKGKKYNVNGDGYYSDVASFGIQINKMTFKEYIIQERGQEFYDISKLDRSKAIVPHTLEQWFPDMYRDYKMLYDKDIKDLEIEYLKKIGEISSKLGYAEGVLQGILHWDIPEELKIKIKEALTKIKEE